MKAEYITHMGSDLMVVNAARVSFNKHKTEIDEKDIKLIGYLARNNHWTPFAHPQVTFRISVPIFVANQLKRHQIGLALNEVSRRYVDDEPEFYVPNDWRKRAENKKQGSGDNFNDDSIESSYFDQVIDGIHDKVRSSYRELIDKGVAPEQARMILPQTMETSWYWTGSLAAFARICKQRLDPHAQEETRQVAEMISVKMAELFPYSWEALVLDGLQ